jgi:hypothetical protein
VRIPLDYYRILGLPIQATPEQLDQAYRDRALQLPRREYSEAAIESRKQLLDEAYAVLSNPEQRAAYDANFLAKTYEQQPDQKNMLGAAETGNSAESPLDAHTSIEIGDEQFVGALLILQEVGEYELVLKLAQPYLGAREGIHLDKGRLGDPQLVRPDIVLTLALACLELGREHWQQGQYENAAISLETGQELLLREGLFPSVRGEIQSDLYKLRPYRILELLALPEENIEERRNGLRLLQEMLQERRGIDGTGDDQSGLSIDDFLRFIQQLRGYLSAAEQQTLFEAEARRPSAVATYLAVYALLARGFAQRQPALIARAKQMLARLGKRQDVHLEQAVCALLLGQTEEASRALELSQEYEPLAFIREHSQGAPDLLPGLCLYGERWLQTSVFPHFRDLRDRKASLKEYFADEQVQAYLEELPDSASESENQWSVQSHQKAYATATPVGGNWGRDRWSDTRRQSHPSSEETAARSQWATQHESVATDRTRAVGLGATAESSRSSNVSTLPVARSAASGGPQEPPLPHDPSSRSRRRQHQSGGGDSTPLATSSPSAEATSEGSSRTAEKSPSPSDGRLQRVSERSKSSTKVQRLILLAVVGLVGLGVLIWVLAAALGWLQKTIQGLSTPALEGEQPLVQLAQPPIPIPEPGAQVVAPEGLLTAETAQQVIQTWLATKPLATGPNYQVEQLEEILVDPILSTWQRRIATYQERNAYWRYPSRHIVEVNSVETSEENPDRATVDAAVKEVAQFYRNGQLIQEEFYDSNLRIRYELVRQEGQWFIRDSEQI